MMRLEKVLSVESIRRNPASAGSHSRGAIYLWVAKVDNRSL